MLDRTADRILGAKLTVIVLVIGILITFLVGCGPSAYERQKEYKYKVYLKDNYYDHTNDIERDSLVIRYVNEDSEKVEAPYINIIKIIEFNQEEQ